MSGLPPRLTRLAEAVLNEAREAGIMIATAESCTGGLISACLTEIAGSSDVFDRGFVTYSYESKADLLGVSVDMIAEHGAVSEPVAAAMADGALRRSKASVTVAVTGVAGPGQSENKPAGLVWFGVACADGRTSTLEKRFGDIGRAKVREETAKVALELLRGAIGGRLA